jgi:hypothetical protein
MIAKNASARDKIDVFLQLLKKGRLEHAPIPLLCLKDVPDWTVEKFLQETIGHQHVPYQFQW